MRIRDRRENTKAHWEEKKKTKLYIFQRPGVNYLCKIWMHNYLMQRLLFVSKQAKWGKSDKDKYHMPLLICGKYWLKNMAQIDLWKSHWWRK